MGLEPTPYAWKAHVLPLNTTSAYGAFAPDVLKSLPLYAIIVL